MNLSWDEVLLAFRQFGGKLPKKQERPLIEFLAGCEERRELEKEAVMEAQRARWKEMRVSAFNQQRQAKSRVFTDQHIAAIRRRIQAQQKKTS